MNLVIWLEQRLGKVSIKSALLFTIINTIFLLLFRDVFIRVGMFVVCAVFLYFLGNNPFVDADPVPFVTGLHLLLYGFLPTLQFILWTIPATDVIANRLNQWTLVNFFSLIISILFVYAIGAGNFMSLVLLILFHNIIRLIISVTLFKKSIIEMRSVLTHFAIYFVLLNALSFLFLF